MTVRDRIFEIAPIAVAVVFGVCAVLFTGVGNTDFGDSADYLVAARMLLESGGYPEVGTLPFFRPPLYPLFMAAIWGFIHDSVLAIKLSQVVLHGATTWLIYKTTERITRKKVVAVVAGLLFAANPFFLYFAAAIQSESLHTFLFTFSLFLIVGMLMGESTRILPAARVGVIVGIAALCKPSALGIGLGLAVLYFLVNYRVDGSFFASATMIAAMFVAILPWSLINWKTKGEFFLINDAGGYNLWVGNFPGAIDLYERTFSNPLEASAHADYLGKTVAKEQIDQWESTVGYKALSLKQRERLWTQKAIENAQQNRSIAIRLLFWKFYNLWKPYVSSSFYSLRTTVLTSVFLITLYLFGMWGMYATWKDGSTKEITLLFVAMALLVSSIHVVIVSSMRLRLPYIDPFLTIFASIGIGNLLNWKLSHRSARFAFEDV